MISFKVLFALALVVAAVFAVEEKSEKADLEPAEGHLFGYGLGYGRGLYGGYGGYGLHGGYAGYGGYGRFGYGLGGLYGHGYGLYGR